MSTTLLIVQTLNGLQLGVLLFLIAAGLTLVFGVMDFINLAHGVSPIVRRSRERDGRYCALAPLAGRGRHRKFNAFGLGEGDSPRVRSRRVPLTVPRFVGPLAMPSPQHKGVYARLRRAMRGEGASIRIALAVKADRLILTRCR
jgi:hypothetical protein